MRDKSDNMRCKKCGYDLRELEKACCPECETKFDIDDPRSFLSKPESGEKCAMLGLAAPLLIAWPIILSYSEYPEILVGPFVMLGPISIITGFTLAWIAMSKGFQAIFNHLPWTEEKSGFWIGLIFGGISFLSMMGKWMYDILVRFTN